MISEEIATLVGIAAWHFAALNGLAMYTRAFATSWLVPKRVLISKQHALGVGAAVSAAAILIVCNSFGYLEYGIFVAGGLLCIDTWMIYRALRPFRY